MFSAISSLISPIPCLKKKLLFDEISYANFAKLFLSLLLLFYLYLSSINGPHTSLIICSRISSGLYPYFVLFFTFYLQLV